MFLKNNYDILTRTELDIGKFIEEIKNEFSGFKQTMEELERRIGLPVVEISALKEEHIDELMKVAYQESLKKREAKYLVIMAFTIYRQNFIHFPLV